MQRLLHHENHAGISGPTEGKFVYGSFHAISSKILATLHGPLSDFAENFTESALQYQMKNSQILGVYGLWFLNYHTFKNVPRLSLWGPQRAICVLNRFVRPMSFLVVEIET